MRDRLASLTPRQLEILRGVAEHLSSKEIALRLGLSPHTVDAHIATALQRLELGNRRDAAMALVRYGYLNDMRRVASIESIGASEPSLGHSGNPLIDHQPLPTQENERLLSTERVPASSRFLRRLFRRQGSGGGGHGTLAHPGMAPVVFRYILDAFYISLFFAIMSGVALGAHLIVIECEHRHIDPVVLLILQCVSYVLAALDAVGVMSATGLLTYRFIRAIVRADD